MPGLGSRITGFGDFVGDLLRRAALPLLHGEEEDRFRQSWSCPAGERSGLPARALCSPSSNRGCDADAVLVCCLSPNLVPLSPAASFWLDYRSFADLIGELLPGEAGICASLAFWAPSPGF